MCVGVDAEVVEAAGGGGGGGGGGGASCLVVFLFLFGGWSGVCVGVCGTEEGECGRDGGEEVGGGLASTFFSSGGVAFRWRVSFGLG